MKNKIKIVFYSYGKKETVVVEESGYFKRLKGEGMFYGITLFNSQLVEVYRQNPNDRRKWYLWRKFTQESFETPED